MKTRYTEQTVDEEIRETMEKLRVQLEWNNRFEKALQPFADRFLLDVCWDRADIGILAKLPLDEQAFKLEVPLYYVGTAKTHEEFRPELTELRRALQVRSFKWLILQGDRGGSSLRDARPHLQYYAKGDRFKVTVKVPWLPTGCEVRKGAPHREIRDYVNYIVSCPIRRKL